MAGMFGPVAWLGAVDAAFNSLPDRYLGAGPGFDATYQIRLCDIGRAWEVRCTDRDLIDPAVADLVVDEFRRIYQSAGARYAFWTSARNIYLEAPFERRGFYPRLSELQSPAVFVWGSHDSLIPPAFGRHVRRWLPRAEQVTLQACGHAPQVERPHETNQLLLDFFDRAEQSGLLPGGARRPDTRAA